MSFKAQSCRSLLYLTVSAFVLVQAGPSVTNLTPKAAPRAVVTVAQAQTVPQSTGLLSDADKAHYRAALALQRAGHAQEASAEAALATNPMLRNVVLAEQPANNAGKLALPAAAGHSVKMVNNGYARSTLQGNKTWNAGLDSFKKKDMAIAAAHFRALADGNNALSPQDRAAVSFWAYRALKALGNNQSAEHYLEKASDSPQGFYSLLARHIVGEEQEMASAVAVLTPQEFAKLKQQAPVARAVALKEIGEDGLAEKELRSVYPRADKALKGRLLALARHLDLPAMQMRIASINASASTESFPIPSWEPASGYQVERALLFAIMRQESGFNPNARSASGALGLMQLMPSTLSAMDNGNRKNAMSLDPSVNIALGQRYVEHLMETPHIGDNLIYLTAAYNAGPGAIASWLHNERAASDPLLFIETIPYGQTRDFVVQVMANYWVYSQMLGVGNTPSLEALALGEWPRYAGPERQLVSLLNRVD